MAKKTSPFTRVTLQDVARASGFSTSSVSIVLNEAPLSRYVAVDTKNHIRKTAQEMGYHPDAFARSLRRRRSDTIGVLVFDISDPFCISLLRGIEHALYQTAYLPIIIDADNRRDQFERYLEMLIERRVEGLVVVANWLFADIDPLSKIANNIIPTVVVGRDLTQNLIQSVVVDNEQGGFLAMQHLHALGHRRIAVLRGPEEMNDSMRRWLGIQRFASEVGLHLEPRLTSQLLSAMDPESSFDGGLNLTKGFIETRLKFSAILAFDDFTALGAMRALWKSGRRVPEDCSVIGFDDIPLASVTTPGITTIRQPMMDMGKLATKLVLEALASPKVGSTITDLLHTMPPELVQRDSTRKILAKTGRGITQ
ncbi:MAG: LacI family transcriptional regulator [Acidobacteria bacterium]|nr:LacI family transcriptional regulator [Acidobacteriota bacterium]